MIDFCGFLSLLSLVILIHQADRWWFAEMVCQLRLPMVLLGAGLIIVSLFRGNWFWALGNLVLTLVLVGDLRRFFDAPPRRTSSSRQIRIATINLEFGRADPVLLGDWLSIENPDVIGLTEFTYSNTPDRGWETALERWRSHYPHQFIVEHPHFGMALLSKLELELPEQVQLKKPGGPVVIERDRPTLIQARIRVSEKTLHLIFAHPVRPGSYSRFLMRRSLFSRLQTLIRTSEPTIVFGDLNSTTDSPFIKKLLKHSYLADTRSGYGYLPSWKWRSIPVLRNFWMLPLDHVLISQCLRATRRSCGPDLGSDHRPVLACVSIS